MERIETIITSPTRGKKYTWAEVLKKGLIRSTLKTEGEFSHLHTCFYGSQDLVWKGEIRVSESLWSDSIGFIIEGDIPFHLTEGKRLRLGWGCGCDRDYHGQFPNECFPEPEEGKWNEYQLQETFGDVIAYLPGNEEAQSIAGTSDCISIEKILEDDSREGKELKRLLEAILKEVILQNFYRGAIKDGERKFQCTNQKCALKCDHKKLHLRKTSCTGEHCQYIYYCREVAK